jgi:O-antigen/teichoic acid export membrane protein
MLKKLRQNRYARDILSMSSAAALGQITALMAAPLITRLYTPDDFGHLAFFQSAISLLAPLVCLRYEFAIPLPAEDSEGYDLVALAVSLSLAISLAFIAITIPLWPIISRAAGMRAISGAALFIPLALFVSGLHTIISFWCVRCQLFALMATMRLISIVGTLSVQLILGYTTGGPNSLLWAFTLGQAAAGAYGVWKSPILIKEIIARLRRRQGPWAAARAYRAFALVSSPSGIVNTLGLQLPALALPWLYGPAVTGSYSLAQRVLGQPILLLGEAAHYVFWGHAARLAVADPRKLRSSFIRTNAILAAVATPLAVLPFYGPEMFGFVFGTEWRQAGAFAGLLSVPTILSLCAVSTEVLLALRLNLWQAGWELAYLSFLVVAIWIAWCSSVRAETCVLAIAAAAAAGYGLLLTLNTVAVRRAAGKGDPE